jgi:hypothetical protein
MLIADIISILLIVVVGFQLGADYTIVFAFLSIIPYLILTGRKKMIKQFLISSTIILLWTLIAKDEYGYNRSFLTLFGVNFFPLFAWACGLFGTYVIFCHFEPFFHKRGSLPKFLIYSFMYWIFLVTMETIGYHVLDIRNVATAHYPGLPILDSMHSPLWMKISYFTLGPIYFLVCNILKRENPLLSSSSNEDKELKLDN